MTFLYPFVQTPNPFMTNQKWKILGSISGILAGICVIILVYSRLTNQFWFSQPLHATNIPSQTTIITLKDEYKLPISPISLVFGDNNDIWFLNHQSPDVPELVHQTQTGAIIESNLGTKDSGYTSLFRGPDKKLWFYMEGTHTIGQLDNVGTIIKTFVLPIDVGTASTGITIGPDNNFWVSGPDLLGRITITGQFTQYSLPSNSNTIGSSVTFGPDGNIWFIEPYQNNAIGRITLQGLQGIITKFSIPGRRNFSVGFTVGPDNTLWFSDYVRDRIAQITVDGVITEYPLPVDQVYPGGLLLGPDRNLWFTSRSGRLWRFSPFTHQLTELLIPDDIRLMIGPNGTLWGDEIYSLMSQNYEKLVQIVINGPLN